MYFAISVVLSLIGWTWLARQLRGKVLALREEEFVLAAQLAGGSDCADHLQPPDPERRPATSSSSRRWRSRA